MANKSKKLQSLKQAHAKEDTEELTSLDQIWGFNKLSRYETLDEGEYENRLKNMTRSDLENHARVIGSVIVESSDRIKSELMKIFRAYVLSLRKPASPAAANIKVSQEVQKILNEGR